MKPVKTRDDPQAEMDEAQDGTGIVTGSGELSPAQLLEAHGRFRAEHPEAPEEFFEAWLELARISEARDVTPEDLAWLVPDKARVA